MKLSFSTNYWKGHTLGEFFSYAADYNFSGIEIHSAEELEDENIGAVDSKQKETNINICCINLTRDIGDKNEAADAARELASCISYSKKLAIPYIRLKCAGDVADKEKIDAAKEFVAKALPEAEKAGITLLIESMGSFSDTSALRDFLDTFASDTLGALWDFFYPFSVCRETPDKSIKNLGAYVKHIHIKDCDDDGAPCLIGEGTLPVKELLMSLRSINYDGYLSLEWNPEWVSELADPDIVFPQFSAYLSSFDETPWKKKTYYKNRAGTGNFIWKKDLLIEKTFSEVLDTMVKNFPDQPAFKYTTLDYSRTYSEFRDDVDEFARALVALGVKAGSHVAIWASNVPQWYITFWATVKLGAVLVTVNTAYKIHEAEYLFRQSDTHTLVMEKGSRDSHYDEIMRELCPELDEKKADAPLHAKRLPFLRNVITVGYEQKGCLTWDAAIAKASLVSKEKVYRMASQVSPNDVCNMQYTSGTTGFPKGVMLTHYNIVNNGKCIGDRMDLSTADRMMIQVPMFHCFGMVLAMTASMTHGSTVLPLPYFSAKSALSCINNEKITAFHGVPTMFISMLEHADFPKTDFSYMRTGIMAGSPCPIAIMKEVVEKMRMTEIVIVYGQTEASPGCTMSSTDDPIEVRVSTVGRAMPEIECKIVDPETGEDLPDNVTGEFVARGYNIMKGYYKMPKETAGAIDKDGWLHTGDLACRTPEGNYRITGRLKDMIIRGGENIYPKEIEEFIYTHPKVSDVQVIGVPDEQYGEEIMACIILKEGETMTEEEIKGYILSHMAKHKVPRYIKFVDSFPMNVAGKILKYKMREDAIKDLGLEKANSTETA